MTYNFTQALKYFKTGVNIKYSPGAVAIRRLQEMGKCRGRGGYGGRDSKRYGGRGIGSGIFGWNRGRGYSPKLGSKVITIMNRKNMDYHASINFSDDIYHIMTNDQQENFQRERNEYQYKQGNTHGGGKKRSIENMQREIDDLKYQVSSNVPGYVSTGPRSYVSQVTTHGTIMG